MCRVGEHLMMDKIFLRCTPYLILVRARRIIDKDYPFFGLVEMFHRNIELAFPG